MLEYRKVKIYIQYLSEYTYLASFFLIFIFSSNLLYAQENLIFQNKRHKLGFITGYGYQNFEQILNDLGPVSATKIRTYLDRKQHNPSRIGMNVSYHYQTQFFQLQYYYTLVHKSSWSLDILFQPQYNKTRIRQRDTTLATKKGYEFGLNGGLLIRKNFFKDFLSIYAYISAGPHFISHAPNRQVKGFIFSDNCFVGMDMRLYKSIYLDLSFGIRHLSNANLKQPNAGINSLIMYSGFFICF